VCPGFSFWSSFFFLPGQKEKDGDKNLYAVVVTSLHCIAAEVRLNGCEKEPDRAQP
jgi:hypothetical protein